MADAPPDGIPAETPAAPGGPSDVAPQETAEEVQQRPGPEMTPPQEPEDAVQGGGTIEAGNVGDTAAPTEPAAPATEGAAAPTTDQPEAAKE